MPGVTANESGDIASQLQEVGQVISTETSQLVDALIHLTLDHEDTDRAIARMGLEASLTKATIEDQAQRVRDVEAALGEENMKREEAEGNLRAVMSESHELRGLVKALRGEGEDPRDEVIKVCSSTCLSCLLISGARVFPLCTRPLVPVDEGFLAFGTRDDPPWALCLAISPEIKEIHFLYIRKTATYSV